MTANPGQPRARLAVSGDAPEIVRLREVMFAAMGLDTSGPTWQEMCRLHLEANLGSARLIGAVVEAPGGNGLAASGVAEVFARIPSPGLPNGAYAYLSSFSTDPRWRRRGYAKSILSLLLEQLHDAGVARIELHASADGSPLYQSFGFVDRTGGREMRLLRATISPAGG